MDEGTEDRDCQSEKKEVVYSLGTKTTLLKAVLDSL